MLSFGLFHFDPAERTLWKGTAPVALTRKAAAVLGCLIEGRGAWVSKSDIMAAVWPDTYVHPDNIKVLVREIRIALGDDSHAPRYIQSEAGRGYAFVAELQQEAMAIAKGPRRDAPLFINRGAELAQLNDAFDSVRACDRRVVFVTGPSGIGKTALADAFVRTTRSTTSIRLAYAKCLMHSGSVEPLYPLLDAVERLGREFPDVVPVLAEHAPTWLQQFPRWKTAGGGNPQDSRSMVDEFCQFAEVLAQDVPLILCLDDLQLADPATIGVIEALATRTSPAKLLILATAAMLQTTPHAQRLQRLIARLRTSPAVAVARLGPLTERNVGRYLDARFGAGCVSSLAPPLRDATAGNPRLMIVGLDGLVERRLLFEIDGVWHRESTPEVLMDVLPEFLLPALERLLDDLDLLDRGLLECAAVVGLEFSAEQVATAADRNVQEVARRLDRLAGEGAFVHVNKPAPRGVRRTYRFGSNLCAKLVADHAPAMQQIRAYQRLGRVTEVIARRA
jgi:DNA-binding winged helix-turn-helix (wHTH) protein